jgi:predicted signal transduction protein with EAL and GGDEF domain
MAVRNLAGVEYIELEAIDINEFHPENDGRGKATEVHLCLKLKAPAGSKQPFFVMRFKGRHTLDQIIAALKEHADRVFGKPS